MYVVHACPAIYSTNFFKTVSVCMYMCVYVSQFAEALLVIPRTLTINAAHDATELVAKLRAHHFASQQAQAKEADGDQVHRIYVCMYVLCMRICVCVGTAESACI